MPEPQSKKTETHVDQLIEKQIQDESKTFCLKIRDFNIETVLDLQNLAFWQCNLKQNKLICLSDSAKKWFGLEKKNHCMAFSEFCKLFSKPEFEKLNEMIEKVEKNETTKLDQVFEIKNKEDRINFYRFKALKNDENLFLGTIEYLELSDNQSVGDFRFMLDRMPVSIYIERKDDHKLLEFNQHFLFRTGYLRKEIFDTNIFDLDLFTEKEKSKVTDYRNSLLNSKDLEISLHTRSGLVRQGILNSQEVIFNDEKCFLNVYVDITELKQLQGELEDHKHRLDELINQRTSKIDNLNKELSALNEELISINDQLSNTNTKLESEIKKHELTEKILIEKENNLRSYFESDMTGIAIFDSTGVWQDMNPKMFEILGYTLDELNEKGWDKIIEQKHFQKNSGLYQKLIDGQLHQLSQEITLIKKDSTIIYADINIREIGSQSQMQKHIIHLQDITKRKVAEKSIRSSERKIRIILEKSPVGIFITDFDGRFVYQNPAFQNLLILDKDIDTKKTFVDFVNIANKAKLIADYQANFYEELSKGQEWTFVKASGEIVHTFHSSIFLKEAEQNFQRVHFVIDLSERKKAETELTRYKEHLELLVKIRTNELKRREQKIRKINRNNQALLQALPYMYFVVSREGFFIDHKKGSEKMFFNEEELVGKNINDPRFQLSSEILKKYNESFERSWETKKVEIFEYHYKLHGRDICIENHLVALSEDEYLCIIHDITKQRKYEQDLIVAREKAIEADRLKTAFLANMSHEIRTPMNAILGFAQLLDDDELDSDSRKKYLEYINRGTNELLSLLTDIVDVSKIEAGKLKINLSVIELREALNDIYQSFLVEIERNSRKKNIQILYRHEDTGMKLNIDQTLLEQVLKNLLSNAYKFTKEGEIELGAKYIENNKVHLFVSDTGIGIEPDKKDIVFERFRQGDEGFSKKYGGTGLGLSIAKSLVEQMGGKIWFESEMGVGTTFFIEFELYRKNSQQEISE